MDKQIIRESLDLINMVKNKEFKNNDVMRLQIGVFLKTNITIEHICKSESLFKTAVLEFRLFNLSDETVLKSLRNKCRFYEKILMNNMYAGFIDFLKYFKFKDLSKAERMYIFKHPHLYGDYKDTIMKEVNYNTIDISEIVPLLEYCIAISGVFQNKGFDIFMEAFNRPEVGNTEDYDIYILNALMDLNNIVYIQVPESRLTYFKHILRKYASISVTDIVLSELCLAGGIRDGK